MATCPECDYDEIDTEDYEEGDTLSCPECGKSLVMIGPDEVDFVDGDEDEDEDDLEEEEEEDELGEDDDDDEDDLDEDEEEEDYDE